MERNYPEIIISDEGVTWLDKGQMWMYKNNLEQCDPQIKNGELVDIVTNKGRYLGTGFISLKSHITVRSRYRPRHIWRNRPVSAVCPSVPTPSPPCFLSIEHTF